MAPPVSNRVSSTLRPVAVFVQANLLIILVVVLPLVSLASVLAVPYGSSAVTNCSDMWDKTGCGNLTAGSSLYGYLGEASSGPWDTLGPLLLLIVATVCVVPIPWWTANPRSEGMGFTPGSLLLGILVSLGPWAGLHPGLGYWTITISFWISWIAAAIRRDELISIRDRERKEAREREKKEEEQAEREAIQREAEEKKRREEEERNAALLEAARQRGKFRKELSRPVAVTTSLLEELSQSERVVWSVAEVISLTKSLSRSADAFWTASSGVSEPLRSALRQCKLALAQVTESVSREIASQGNLDTQIAVPMRTTDEFALSRRALNLAKVLDDLRGKVAVRPDEEEQLEHERESIQLLCHRLSESAREFSTAFVIEIRGGLVEQARGRGEPRSGEERHGRIRADTGAVRRTGASTREWGVWQFAGGLDSGGNGKIYRVRSKVSGEEGVLKEPIRGNDEKALARFNKEIAIMRQAHHENVIRVLDSSIDPSYYVMEAADSNLSAHLKDFKGNTRRALVTFLEICEGVRYAHETLGVIHRDLKPQNILLKGVVPKVCDFGLCHLIAPPAEGSSGGVTEPFEQTGSRFFIAPECMWGDRVDSDQRADIFSLGKVLHYMVSGGVKFPIDEFRQVTPVATDLETLFPTDASMKEVNRLLAQMITRSPDDRYPTVRVVMDDAARVLGRLLPPMTGAGLDPTTEVPAAPDLRGSAGTEPAKALSPTAWVSRAPATSDPGVLQLNREWYREHCKLLASSDGPLAALEGVSVVGTTRWGEADGWTGPALRVLDPAGDVGDSWIPVEDIAFYHLVKDHVEANASLSGPWRDLRQMAEEHRARRSAYDSSLEAKVRSRASTILGTSVTWNTASNPPPGGRWFNLESLCSLVDTRVQAGPIPEKYNDRVSPDRVDIILGANPLVGTLDKEECEREVALVLQRPDGGTLHTIAASLVSELGSDSALKALWIPVAESKAQVEKLRRHFVELVRKYREGVSLSWRLDEECPECVRKNPR